MLWMLEDHFRLDFLLSFFLSFAALRFHIAVFRPCPTSCLLRSCCWQTRRQRPLGHGRAQKKGDSPLLLLPSSPRPQRERATRLFVLLYPFPASQSRARMHCRHCCARECGGGGGPTDGLWFLSALPKCGRTGERASGDGLSWPAGCARAATALP